VPRALKVLVVLAAGLTVVARVHLVVHWPLDVVGGVAVGVLVAGLVVVALDPAPVPAAWPGAGLWPPMSSAGARRLATAPDADAPLRVATFNVRNGWALDGSHAWPFRRRAAAATIEALGADLVGLQEVYSFQRRGLARQVVGRRWIGAGRTDGGGRGEQCPITWRPSRLHLEAWEVRWFSAHPDVAGTRLEGARAPRIATLARFWDMRSGLLFGVANAHLDAARADLRARAAGMLVGWMAEHPVPWIVLGDLNDGPDSETVAAIEAAGFRALVPEDGSGTAHQFTGRTDGRQIDHVLIDEDWTAGPVTVPAGSSRPLPSDHWPVVVDLRGPSARR
jgi:endonuclease/exonuclease/phosphatase family metal-dependent hydrolase